jgi:hypothetical protein
MQQIADWLEKLGMSEHVEGLPGNMVRERNKEGEGRPVNIIVRASGPSGPAKIPSDDPNHALGLVQYLRTIGYKAWIEDANGNQIEETILKNSMK